jgi:flavin-dependent dehydrogenase
MKALAMKMADESDNVDVVVLGGGPAGATAALVLAAKGRRVRVIEKARFPRFHVGESLLPYNQGLFEELGLEDEMVKGSGFMVKRAAQFWSGAGQPGARLEFAKGSFTEFKHAYQVERSVFDEKLLRAAERRGAQVWEGHGYVSHELNGDGVRLRCRDEAGETREMRAKFVVDATGMHAVTARKAGLRKERSGHRKVALFGHFEGVEMPAGEELGDIVLLIRDRAWVWMIPLDERRTSVGLVMGREEFDAGRGDQEALWQRIVMETPELKRRMAGATRLGGLHLEADYSFSVDRLIEPRLVRAGDAAGFLDPVFSSGVMLAMESGRDAARVVDEALRVDQPMTLGMRAYEKAVNDHLALFWEFVEAFYTRPFIELFLQPQGRLNLMSAINAVLAGRAKLPWGVRWRLRVFFLLVKLQRHVPVVTHLKWTKGRPPEVMGRGALDAGKLAGKLEPVTGNR